MLILVTLQTFLWSFLDSERHSMFPICVIRYFVFSIKLNLWSDGQITLQWTGQWVDNAPIKFPEIYIFFSFSSEVWGC